MSKEQTRFFSPEKSLPQIIKQVAETHKLDLPDETLVGMIVIASACGITDDEIDRCKDFSKRRTIVQNALSYLEGKEGLAKTGSPTFPAYQEAIGYLKTLFNSFPDEKKGGFIRKLRIWDRLSEEQKTTEAIDRYTRLRLVDLNVTAGIYLEAIPDEFRKNPEFKSFLKNFKRMVRIAGMLDDSMDFPDDYKNGITIIKPNLNNRLKLASRAIFEGVGMMSFALRSGLLVDSYKIMKREFERRKTKNNFVQYKNLDPNFESTDFS